MSYKVKCANEISADVISALDGSSNKPNNRRWVILAILCCSLFVAGIDLTVLHNAALALQITLHPSAVQLLWILDSYSLTVAALLVTCGTLGDKYGRKRFILVGFIIFGIASLGCAYAQNSAELILARICLGVGTSLIMAATVAIIRVVFINPQERAFAIGIWTACYSIGTSLGPIVSGILLDNFWWGAVFLLNVPIAVLVVIMGIIFIPESKNPQPRSWDMVSAILSIVALGSIVYAIKIIGVKSRFDIEDSLIGLGGIICLIIFIQRQKCLEEPLLDVRLFKKSQFSSAVISALLCFGCYTAALYFLVNWFHNMWHCSALQAGLALCPMAVANAGGSIFAPKIAQYCGLYRTIVIGLGGFSLMSFVFAILPFSERKYIFLIIIMLVLGIAAGLIMTLGADAIMSAADPDRSGEAAAIQETSFELGTGLGIGLLGLIWNLLYRAQEMKSPNLRAGPENRHSTFLQLDQIYDHATRGVFWSMGMVLFLCFIGIFWVNRKSIIRKIPDN